MTGKQMADLRTVAETVEYALLQAEMTFDPLIRDGLAGGKKGHAEMVKAGIAGTPSLLTLKLRDAKAILARLTEPIGVR